MVVISLKRRVVIKSFKVRIQRFLFAIFFFDKAKVRIFSTGIIAEECENKIN